MGEETWWINNSEGSVGTEIEARVGWDHEDPAFWLPRYILCVGSQLVTAGTKRSKEVYKREGCVLTESVYYHSFLCMF